MPFDSDSEPPAQITQGFHFFDSDTSERFAVLLVDLRGPPLLTIDHAVEVLWRQAQAEKDAGEYGPMHALLKLPSTAYSSDRSRQFQLVATASHPGLFLTVPRDVIVADDVMRAVERAEGMPTPTMAMLPGDVVKGTGPARRPTC